MLKLGDEVIFDCDPRYRTYTIPRIYASSQLLSKYQFWHQIDKKRVVVSQIINTSSNTVRVYVKDDGPQYTFAIDAIYLKAAAPAAAAQCICPTQTLMIKGCVCGYLKKEAKTTLQSTPW